MKPCNCFSFAVMWLIVSFPALLFGEVPKIAIVNVPCAGAGDPIKTTTISGSVTGVKNSKLKDYRVVVYAFTNKWWVQPTADQPLTNIVSVDGGQGKWLTDTHPGSSYLAILVKSTYQPSSSAEAPPNPDGKNVLDIVRVAGRAASSGCQ